MTVVCLWFNEPSPYADIISLHTKQSPAHSPKNCNVMMVNFGLNFFPTLSFVAFLFCLHLLLLMAGLFAKRRQFNFQVTSYTSSANYWLRMKGWWRCWWWWWRWVATPHCIICITFTKSHQGVWGLTHVNNESHVEKKNFKTNFSSDRKKWKKKLREMRENSFTFIYSLQILFAYISLLSAALASEAYMQHSHIH
jgi:hypothetical protein